ncbi:hypothetical protein BC832DRAFT_568707 [Gaertneriomyces semiglobifer]|nr:hypothetical protein BC832DRAFT_568707 [Gaertneriomyces semiglobifer]
MVFCLLFFDLGFVLLWAGRPTRPYAPIRQCCSPCVSTTEIRWPLRFDQGLLNVMDELKSRSCYF